MFCANVAFAKQRTANSSVTLASLSIVVLTAEPGLMHWTLEWPSTQNDRLRQQILLTYGPEFDLTGQAKFLSHIYGCNLLSKLLPNGLQATECLRAPLIRAAAGWPL